MNSTEREKLRELDDFILNSSPEELSKIQEIDFQTQLHGSSLYDIYFDSTALTEQQTITKTNKKN
ncbi:hypothetical protein [Nitrosopumilus sp.]|uniref:hypothetical protein n=1 Tax=Nitrosopumilus sp. TaxID=2024843 RepID=UPI003B58DADD